MFALATEMFIILNPIGTALLLTKLLKTVPSKDRISIIIQESLASILILLTFYSFGNCVLNYLNIHIGAVYLTGAILLGKVALNLNFPGQVDLGSMLGLKPGERPFVVPIAMPMLAGPGSLVNMIRFSQDAIRYPVPKVLGAFTILAITSTLSLIATPYLMQKLGTKFVGVIERIIGLLLLMIAITIGAEGIKLFLPLNL